MSIIFKSQTKQLIAKGYTGKLAYLEGYIRIPLPIIEFKNYKAFAEELTFTFTVDNSSGFLVNMESTPTNEANNISITKDGDVYTLKGVNWKFMKEHLETLYLVTHDDMDVDFTIDVNVSDGFSTPLDGQYVYTATAIVDNIANDGNGTNTQADIQPAKLEVVYLEDTAQEYTKELRIDDQSGPYTNKKYKVTVSTVPDVLADYRDLDERVNVANCGAGYVFRSTDLMNFNVLQKFHSDEIVENGQFGSKVITDFTYINDVQDFSVSFYGNTGERYSLRNDKCRYAGWDKTGDLSYETVEPNRTGSYAGDDFSVSVIGSPVADIVTVTDSGSVEPIVLQGFDTDPGDNFGHAIHLSENGKLLFVTAPNDTATNKGTIYVFKRTELEEAQINLPDDSCGIGIGNNNTTVEWTQIQSWNAPVLVDDTRFGINFKVVDKTGNKSCCIPPVMGEYVFITAEEPDKAGAIYVYRTNDEANWAYVTTLTSTNPRADSLFGFDFSIDLFRDTLNDQILEMFISVGEPQADNDFTYNIDEDTKNLTVIGDQHTVNHILDEVEYFIAIGNDQYDLVFTQEVIEGNDFVPYIQEEIITNVAVRNGLVVELNFTYDEDVPLEFTPAQFDLDVVNDKTTYEIQFITDDPNFGYLNASNLTGTPSELNAALRNMLMIPQADFNGMFTLDLRLLNLTDSIEYGVAVIAFNVGVAHPEFVLNGPFTYNEDTPVTMNLGRVTDLRADIIVSSADDFFQGYVLNITPDVTAEDFAPAKVDPDDSTSVDFFNATVINVPTDAFQTPLYSIQLGLSDENAGTLDPSVITGTKAEVTNALSVVTFTPGVDYTDNFDITYSQQQTTDSVDQGSGNIRLNINQTHDNFLLNGPFTYNEDEIFVFEVGAITDLRPDNIDENIHYQVDLVLSDTNAGTIGPSVITGTKSEVNAILQNITFTPSVDYTNNFTLSYSQQQTTDSSDQGSAVISMNIGNIDANNGFTVNPGPYDWTVNSNTGFFNFANITDNRGNFDGVLYRVLIVTTPPTNDSNGQFRSFGTGGSSIWDNDTTLTIEGTKAEVQSHLDSVEWWSRGSSDPLGYTVSLSRQIDGGPYELLNSVAPNPTETGTTLPSPNNTNINRVYDEDIKTNFDDASKTS